MVNFLGKQLGYLQHPLKPHGFWPYMPLAEGRARGRSVGRSGLICCTRTKGGPVLGSALDCKLDFNYDNDSDIKLSRYQI